MLRQYEIVPKQYEEEAAGAAATAAAAAGTNPSLTLKSTDANLEEPCTFYFEALKPGLFRTTFTTSKHPLPPFPSTQRPSPNLDSVATSTTSPGPKTRSMQVGDVRAEVDWEDGSPVVSLYLDGQESPLHRDLPYRSYALDSTGVAHYLKWNKDTLHVGLGEKAAPMNLDGRGFQITASDTFGYDAYKTDPLYKHIPLLINMTPQGVVGIFSSSHARSTWSVGSEIDGMWGHFRAHRQAHGGLEEYLLVGKTVGEVTRRYAELVGFPQLVPRYMAGYVSGGMKYSMEDSPRAVDSIVGFLDNCEKHGMPCTAHQMSSGYTVSHVPPKTRNVFTWNPHRFPDPRAYTREAHKRGVRILANVKPYVLASHPEYDALVKSGAFFSDPVTKQVAVCRLWSAGGGESGVGSHIDFTSKAGYDWWYKGCADLKEVGIDVMWNDNNEYNIPSDDWQCALETVDIPEGITRRDVGLWGRALNTELMGRSSHDATLAGEPGVRPFVLTRSATAGTMKYCGSSWSGDNVTSWEGMRGANALALNAAFSLVHCYGHDIGGFEGPQPTPEHLTRWIQLGVHSPRFVINCYKTSKEDNLIGEVIEPWQYPSAAPIIRRTIERRYQLVPYTYSLMLRSHREAYPPQRWTGWGYERDPEVWSSPEVTNGDTQYWFGDTLLIAGVYAPGQTSARVYLPDASGKGEDPGFLNTNYPHEYLAAGAWHDVHSVWYESIPVLARIGGAVPVGKGKPTTTLREGEGDEGTGEFPLPRNWERDDWRGVEVFPPPLRELPHLPEGTDASGAARKTKTGEEKKEWKVFKNSWLEDDGTSRVEKAEAVKVDIEYAVGADEIRVKATAAREGGWEPMWVANGLRFVMPVGEERPVSLAEGAKGAAVVEEERDGTGRRVWKVDVEVL